MNRFDAFRSNVHSQNGEDGVLRELLLRMRSFVSDNPWCVEFGAWDGRHLSNTFNLVEAHEWNAVYIEGDVSKFQALQSTAGSFPKIHPISAQIGTSRSPGVQLDQVLAETPLPKTFELLSIDIDSYDLDVWTELQHYTPRIVVIEINSTFPPGVMKWCTSDETGSSFSSTVKVANDKGYVPVCHTGNLILVQNEIAPMLDLNPLDLAYPERLFCWDWVPKHFPKTPRALWQSLFR